MGLEFYDFSYEWGLGQFCWLYFEDVKIECLYGMFKFGVFIQCIIMVMYLGIYIDVLVYVVEGIFFMD